jgi:hypothetical protein
MRRGWLLAVALCALAGCGRGEKDRPSSLGFEQLSDTAGITRGGPLLTAFEPYRMGNGAMRVRGKAEFPDGTRLQISIYRKSGHVMVQGVQVTIADRSFDSPPLIGERGPLPLDDYRFEVRAFFDENWQPGEVLRATDDGRTLRGPGITRDQRGRAAFLLEREARL